MAQDGSLQVTRVIVVLSDKVTIGHKVGPLPGPCPAGLPVCEAGWIYSEGTNERPKRACRAAAVTKVA